MSRISPVFFIHKIARLSALSVADLVGTSADHAWSAFIRTTLPNQAYRLASEDMIPALDHLP